MRAAWASSSLQLQAVGTADLGLPGRHAATGCNKRLGQPRDVLDWPAYLGVVLLG